LEVPWSGQIDMAFANTGLISEARSGGGREMLFRRRRRRLVYD
jgi:hypothetical protein